MDLESIAQEVRICKKCPLSKGRTHAVPGEGNPNAKVLFIGEAPGQNEDQEGKPFVGEAGKFLTEMLESVDLKREDVFITNVVKCRPPNNRDPLEEEVHTCTSNYLFNQIKLIKPKLIVTLGRHSMHVIFPQIKSITEAHGKAYRKSGQIYLVLYHPAASLYQPSLKQIMLDDFQQVPKLLKML